MKINKNIYPYNIEVKNLPFHLNGIGGTEWQGHVNRPDGYRWHQILFCAEGEGVLKYDNLSEPISVGTFFFLPSGYPHEYYSENEKWDVRWVSFDGYAVDQIFAQFDMTHPVVIKPDDPSTLEALFDRMFNAQTEDRLYCGYLCSGLIYEYIIEFHRYMKDTDGKSRINRGRIIIPVLNYIDKNFRNNFPLTALAEVAGVSPQHLCRVFKETMNMRPNEYLTHKRIQEAKRLLEAGNMPISEVASESGFLDAGYFSTVFKRSEGLTPVEYRSRWR